MITDAEKTELRRFLKFLSSEELVSLKDTITNKLIETTSDAETIDAILAHSLSANELLHRQKLNKRCIFRYLSEKKVNVSASASKQDLIGMVLVILDGCLDVPARISKEPPKYKTPEPVQEDAVTKLPTSQQQALAVQFSKWFYSLLNSHNPCQAKSPLDSWGPHHFWSDCQLVLKVSLIDEDRTESFEGADIVSERLLCMAKDELLVFNPNLSEFGTKGKMNRHGVTLVLVCGTLHLKSECLGTFEQCFALISDPMVENNWKVKSTNLSIMRKDLKSTPRLKDASVLALTAE